MTREELLKTAKPILFNTDMVRAILDGRKTATRRCVKYKYSNTEMIKPICCEDCGANTKLSAHHNDYSKPLDVIWICYECHGKRHRKN